MNILGIGTDIIECLRIAQMIERHGELFLNRVYTPHEIEYCSARKAANQHYAGRFAVKEAVMKALGTGWTRGVRWVDIEVVRSPGGPPELVLHGETKAIAAARGIDRWHVTITHDAGIAAAVVVAEARGS